MISTFLLSGLGGRGKMKKFISFLLCLALCFNLIPTIMFAEDPEPYLGPFEGLDDPREFIQ